MIDPGAIPMDEPLAYFLTWTTYGTWLPGDDRGWVQSGRGVQQPDSRREEISRRRMTESACVLDHQQRQLVEETIRAHCKFRNWHLWGVNCRTNHVHVVVTAREHPKVVMGQFKAWCTRRLKQRSADLGQASRENWWTEDGSKRYLNDEASLEGAVRYVLEGQ
jgi:REP element-mobilizing transposase RayT